MFRLRSIPTVIDLTAPGPIGAGTPGTGSFTTLIASGSVTAQGGNAPTGGFHIPRVNGTVTPRITNDGSDATVIRPGVSGGSVKINNFANSLELIIFADSGAVTFAGTISTSAGKLIVTTPETPATAAATGTIGTITWDANYIYVCTATNTWKRVAIATW